MKKWYRGRSDWWESSLPVTITLAWKFFGQDWRRKMAANKTSEERVLEALRQVPSDQWPAVLQYLASLKATMLDNSLAPIRTASDLLGSELIGIWSKRQDIANNRDFAQKVREEAEHRSGTPHAAGH